MLQKSRTILLVAIGIFATILAVGVAIITFQLGQQAAATGPANVASNPTATTTPPAPRIVTNTPTATASPTPTNTTTPTPTLTPTSTPTPSPTPIVVITHINGLGRLETTEFAMRTVIDLENEPANLWEDIFGSDKLMLMAEGEVVAGFDLNKVTKGDITVEGRHVEITLPVPEILYSRIDNERTQVYKRNTGLLVSPDKTLEGRARQLAEEALVKWAIERDIFDAAEDAGRIQLEGLLRSLGFTDIEINVKEKEL